MKSRRYVSSSVIVVQSESLVERREPPPSLLSKTALNKLSSEDAVILSKACLLFFKYLLE